MRRLIPHALLLTMTVLALVALVLSLSSAQRISTFGTPTPGDRATVSSFHAVVLRSLDASGFTIDHAINFQSPDRTSTAALAPGPGNRAMAVRVIGRTAYLELEGSTSAAPRWGRAPLTHLVDENLGPTRATHEFVQFLRDDSVVREGNTFVVRRVVPADSLIAGNPGEVLVTFNVVVTGHYVTGVSAQLQGWISLPTGGTPGHYSWIRVDHYQLPQTTYSDYGHVAPIVSPPPADTVALATCANGTYAMDILGHHVCSIFG